MGKITPITPNKSCSATFSSTSYMSTSKTETFTIWMKSLLMQIHGCTIYNQNGEIVCRVDNYDKKGSNDVYLMDLNGRVLFTIKRRKLWLFRQWKGYICDGLERGNRKKPFFQVSKRYGISEGDCVSYKVALRPSNAQDSFYKMESSSGKLAFKIINNNGEIVAEAKRKQTSSGVLLGDDVLTLVVEPNVDRSFIMALVTVHGLINNKF